ELGILKSEITKKNFDISTEVYAFILDTEALVKAERTAKSYLPYSQYPEIWLDMSVLVPLEVVSSDLKKAIIAAGGSLVTNVEIINFIEKEHRRSILIRITYQSKERTLSLEEINALHITIENSLKSKFNAVIQGREETTMQNRQLTNINENKDLLFKIEKELSTLPEELSRISNEFIVIGKILEIAQHPNADKLVICKVDVGKAKPDGTLYPDYLQIITGADNIIPGIAEGKIIPVALPGAIVKSHKTGKPIKIGISKIRGEVSEGMLCSSDELELSNPGYDGILILEEEMEGKVGEKFTL
ncbi:MAG: hypothetical protein SNJ71_08190, partial [Bacteroidales bacterium]